MPVDHLKDVDQREWPLEPVESDAAKLVVTRTRVTRDAGLPTQTIIETWEAEIVRSRVKILVCQEATEVEFDAALNTWRQAIVDARNTLPAMV